MEDPLTSPAVRRFIEITLPSLVTELSKLNANVARALDYYSVDDRVPDKDKESS
jgi:hypothetical protein